MKLQREEHLTRGFLENLESFLVIFLFYSQDLQYGRFALLCTRNNKEERLANEAKEKNRKFVFRRRCPRHIRTSCLKSQMARTTAAENTLSCVLFCLRTIRCFIIIVVKEPSTGQICSRRSHFLPIQSFPCTLYFWQTVENLVHPRMQILSPD